MLSYKVLLNPASVSRLMVRATNWVGDAVMSLPAIRALRTIFTNAQITVVARPWVADIYARERAIDRILRYDARGWRRRIGFGIELGDENFDCAVLLQNAFDAGAMAWLANIPVRIGYRRDARGWLLTHAIPAPEPGETPRHERYYYLELLRRAGLLEHYPACETIELDGIEKARADGAKTMEMLGYQGPFIGVSPGAAYGNAKRWLPDRFAAAASALAAERGAKVLVFGSRDERALGDQVAEAIRQTGVQVINLAGQTSLGGFIDYAANCDAMLTNDSGAMHLASALGLPTVAIFGATDDTTTGPSGPRTRVLRHQVECSPCLLRECPIDHRCMTAVTVDEVVKAAQRLLRP